MSLFDHQEAKHLEQARPLAARMRPKTLEEFAGGFAHRTGLRASIRVSGRIDGAPPDIQRSILRVLQDAHGQRVDLALVLAHELLERVVVARAAAMHQISIGIT